MNRATSLREWLVLYEAETHVAAHARCREALRLFTTPQLLTLMNHVGLLDSTWGHLLDELQQRGDL